MAKKKSSRKVSKGKSKSHEKKATEKVAVVKKKVKKERFSFFSKNWVWFLVLLLVSVFFATQVRLYSWNLTGVSYNVMSNYQNYVKNNIKQEILKKYVVAPPTAQLNALVNQQYNKLISQNREQFNSQLNSVIAHTKAQFRNPQNETFLLAIDPYFWYRYIVNKVDTGHFYDVLKNGVPWDNHMIAPLGRKFTLNYHLWVGYLWYKFIHPFTHLSVMGSFFFVPIIIMMLVVLAAFFMGDYFGGPLVGFALSLFIGLNGSILARTTGGFADTDVYNILFPLVVSLFAILAYEHKNDKKFWLYSILGGFSLGLFVDFWSGWWFIADIIMGAMGLMLVFTIVVSVIEKNRGKKKKFDWRPILNDVKYITVFLAISQVFLFIFGGFGANLLSGMSQGASSTQIKDSSMSTLWPNVFTTVAELNYGRFSDLVNGLINPSVAASGMNSSLSLAKAFSAMYALFALFGIGYLAYTSMKNKKYHYIFAGLLFLLWFGIMSYATLQGIRFAIFIVTPYAVFASIGIYALFKMLNDGFFRLKDIYWKIITLVFMIIMLYPVYADAKVVGINEMPSMSMGWYNALTKIKTDSQTNAIINSWWDFGHWFKAIANRSVTFDGGTQNSPMAHWIGLVLQTGNESKAVSILRMLDCGSNNAFNVLNAKYKNTLTSINRLDKLLTMNVADARALLERDGFNSSSINQFVNYTFCKPPEDFFITSNDMVGKAGVWAHFGLWNFKRAMEWVDLRNYSYDQMKKLLVSKYNETSTDANSIAAEIETLKMSPNPQVASNNWISPWPSYITRSAQSCTGNETLTCTLNLELPYSSSQKFQLVSFVLNESNYSNSYFNAMLPYNMGYAPATIKPGKLFIVNSGKTYDVNQNFSLGVAINTKTKKMIVSSDSLVNSMFTRLFFFDGANARYFHKFYEDYATGTGKVIVWDVNWTKVEQEKGVYQ